MREKLVEARVARGLSQVQVIEVCRDDQPRDIERCTSLWTKDITTAKEIKSQLLLTKAKATYQMMRAAWPTEQRIKDLRDLLQ